MKNLTLFFVAIFSGLSLSAGPARAAAPKWKIETVDRAAPGDRVVQLSLRPDGSQHIVYTGCSDAPCNNSELFYATRKSPDLNWTTKSIDSNGNDIGWFPSLSFDQNGTPHIFYADHAKQQMYHATPSSSDATNWSIEKLSSGRGGWWTSSAAASGAIYVANTKLQDSGWDNASLELGTLKDGQWSYEIVDAVRDAGWFTSMALMPDGSPVISYNAVFNMPIGTIKIAYKQNGKWNIVTVDDGSIKHHVTVDSQGFIHLVYQKDMGSTSDAGKHALMYVTNAPDGNLHREMLQQGGVAGSPDTGDFPRVTTDSRGGIHIAYVYNETQLAYARKHSADASWDFSTVTTIGAAIYPWIETDSKGQVHIAWEDDGQIQYAVCADCANK